jgi:hypothetical protein
LLVRLLSGRDPLPEPPPLAFSYPWYQLIEQGWDEGYMDIGVYPEGVPVYQDEQPSIMICQARWLIEEKVSATEWIVAWEPTGLRARLEITDDVGGAGKHGRLTVLVSTAA